MTAGPTPVPPAVSQAMAAPMLYHRAPAFVELYERVLGKLPDVFQTSNDVLVFAASGSRRAWSPPPPTSSARARRCSSAPPASSASAGSSSCEAYGAEIVRYEPGWGERLDPAEIDRLLGENDGDRGRLRHAERDLHRRRPRRPGDRRGRPSATARSSPSTPSPASARPSCARTSGAIDVVVAGSQKALMCPPGLALRVASPSARSTTPAQRPGGRYYFDWGKTAKGQREGRRARSRRPCRCSSASTSRST